VSERRPSGVVGIWRSSHTGTVRTGKMTGSCGCGSWRSRRHGFGMDIVGLRSCFGARAGASITRGPIESTARRDSAYVGGVLAGMSRAADGWHGRQSSVQTRAGAWILSSIASSSAIGFVP
jgi:hypothetical protein